MDATTTLETRRLDATRHLDPKHRSTFGQFFTPRPVAKFMASLVDVPIRPQAVSVLDPGAGIGLLSAAVLEKLAGVGKVTAYELEPTFQEGLHETLSTFSGNHKIKCADFIEEAVRAVATGKALGGIYDVVIANPPYKKIQTGTHHRQLLRKIGVETSNLYTCFTACAVALCRPGAQMVVIIPRSWMNGPYFKPFRYWLLDRVAISHIHVFDSRDSAFKDDEVLQENVILRMVVRGKQGPVVVTSSHDQTFTDLASRTVPWSEIVTPGDEEMFVHVPKLGAAATAGLPGKPLREIGLDICTGPVVDFRMRDHLRMEPEAGSVPLLYATHFAEGRFEWPKQTRKPNAIMLNSESRGWLMPNGCYVVTRRFTSKEEKRRVVAYLLPDGALPGDLIGFENHVNVFHDAKHGLEPAVAQGLCAYLNSQAVDDYFRTFSGHTQVNATDLRRLKYPSIEQLRAMGEGSAQKCSRGAADSD